MKKLFTILSAMLFATGVFAATEQAWYNDVTSITANGQYYIYSVKGKGFVQANQSKVKTVNTTNYTATSDLLFTITAQTDGKAYNGSKYLSSYQAGTCGPTGSSSDDGSKLIWTLMNSGAFWNIHGHYTAFFAERWAALYYDNGYSAKANITGGKTNYTDEQYRWYVISPAQYDRHFAIYFFDAYKEGLNISQYNGLVPAAYYTALEAAYGQTFSVQNAEHSAEVVNAAKANLETLYTGAASVAAAYATATGAINALEAVEDKGEDFAEVTTDITNARTALEQALNVEAVNAAVANLKAIDPITFNVTTFEAPNFVTNAASTAAGRTITYAAANTAVINANCQAIYAGTTTLTATAAATDAYYKFVRTAQVNVTAPTTNGEFAEATCGEAVEFNGQTYAESFAGQVTLTNIYGGDSIVAVTITINQPTYSEDSKTIVYGAAESWNGYNLAEQAVGSRDLQFTTTNVAGCDSVVTLHLTVNKMATLEVYYPIGFCAGDSAEYRGKWYYENALDTIYAEGDVRDTIIYVEAMLLPTTDQIVLYDTIVSGNEVILPEGEWVIGEDTVSGTYPTVESEDASELIFHQYFDEPVVCGPNYIELIVTVTPKEQKPGDTTTDIEDVLDAQKAEKVLIDGVLYIRRGDRLFTAEGREVK